MANTACVGLVNRALHASWTRAASHAKFLKDALGVIHQDVPHHVGRQAQDLRPVLPVHLRLVHQLKVGQRVQVCTCVLRRTRAIA